MTLARLALPTTLLLLLASCATRRAPIALPAPPASPALSVARPPLPRIGYSVQVGAFSSHASAESGWSKLSSDYDALKGVKHRIIEGKADIGTVYRLQAVTPDRASAHALCSKLKAANLNCQVK